VILKSGLGSFKVIGNGILRQIAYEFLLAFHSNYGPVLYHFRDKARYWSKIVFFSYPMYSAPPLGAVPVGILPEGSVRKNWNGVGIRSWKMFEDRPMIRPTRFDTLHERDGQTDGHRTTVQARLCIASRGKK